MKPLVLGGLLALLCAQVALAQRPPLRWGDVPAEHLAMTEFPDDPDAHAVILGDFAEVEVGTNGHVEYRRHRRVKLLAEGGYRLATVTLVYDAGNRAQTVDGIRGHTLLPQANGSVRRVALERNSIFTENLRDGYRRVTFTLPALEPGAVIEFSYRYYSTSPMFIPRWDFQEGEPVLWSEYRVEHPRTTSYAFLTLNARAFSVSTQEPGKRPGTDTWVRRWVAENVPALREEPFMTTPEDHVQKLEGQLAEYARPGFGVIRVLRTWPELAENLRTHPNLGRLLNAPRSVRRQAEELAAPHATDEAKARAIYDFLRAGIVWDGRRHVIADVPPARVLETRSGNAAEINLLLVAMLRQAGLEAEAALLSTRDHGTIIDVFPIVSQFNLTVAALRLGTRWVLLDATDPHRPFGMLPSAALNGRAWVAAPRPQWVEIPAGSSAHTVRLVGEVTPEGALVGTLRSERSGYSALGARADLREHGLEKYALEHLLEGVAGLEVSGVAVEHADDHEQPLITSATVRLDGYLQAVGDLAMLHVKPLLREDESPFTRPTRTFPVDFAYPRATEFSAEIRLPEGAAVAEVPQYAFFVVPNRGGVYERQLEVRDGVMHVTVKRTVSRPRFEPAEYGAVRDFFDRVAAAERDVIVLRGVAPRTDP